MFAGLWAIIAIWPRGQPGVWEMLLAHKVAITVSALANSSAATATQTAAIDGWLAWRRFQAQS